MLTASNVKDFIKTIMPDGLLIHRLPPTANNTILLTFDDGPNEKITPLVLERLEAYKATAIFFVIGEKVDKLPHIFEMIISRGHIIGNHTYSHPYQKIPSIREYHDDIRRCQKTIMKHQKKSPTLYRSPAGILSISGLLLAKKLHLKTILWSIEGGEWGVNKKDNAQIISQRLLENLQPRDIVLLHDNNEKTPAILDNILPNLKNRQIDLLSGVKFLCP
jgi:peptidoglycan/xylan/chitin deacetylase (PgdA/CDA1 family)